jgi:hypothetical protein
LFEGGIFMASDYADSFAGEPYFIQKGEQLSAAGMNAALNTKEKVANKKDTISNSVAEYPSSKAVHDAIQTINTSLDSKQDKITAGTASNIVAYSGMAGTFGTLIRSTTVGAEVNASNDNIPTEKAVASALADKANASDLAGKADASALTALGTTVAGKQDQLSVEQINLLNSLKTLSYFPRGTILAFSATAWDEASAEFKTVWKICDGGNGTPNLVGKFIRGGAYAKYGEVGGTDTAQVPYHNHGVTDAGHGHGVTDPGHNHSVALINGVSGSSYIFGMPYAKNVPNQFHTAAEGYPVINASGTGISIVGSAANITVDYAGTTADNRPAFYTLIFIMKVV